MLSPLIFVLCMNTLHSSLPSSVHPVKYADELTLTELLPGKLPGQTQAVINAVAEWGKTNCLYMKEEKTKNMVICFKRVADKASPPVVAVNCHPAECVESFLLLGVMVSADLTWDKHIRYILKKVTLMIYCLSVARQTGLPTEILLQVQCHRKVFRPLDFLHILLLYSLILICIKCFFPLINLHTIAIVTK